MWNYLYFYPKDWLNDTKLQTCSIQAQSMFINLMCFMHQSEEYGFLLINGTKPNDKTIINQLKTHHKTYHKGMQELIINGVIKIDSREVYYCSRMVEDNRIRLVRRQTGSMGGNPVLLNQEVNQVVNQKC